MNSTIWEINGLSLEFDLEDYDTIKRYKELLAEMGENEKELMKEIDVESPEFIKDYCLMFYRFFDGLLGENVSEKIFGGKYNSRLCDETWISFLSFLQVQIEGTKDRKRNMTQYRAKQGK